MFRKHHVMMFVHSKVITLLLPAALTATPNTTFTQSNKTGMPWNTHQPATRPALSNSDGQIKKRYFLPHQSDISPLQMPSCSRSKRVEIIGCQIPRSPFSLSLFPSRARFATHVKPGARCTLAQTLPQSRALIYHKSILDSTCDSGSLFLESCFSFPHCIGVT